MTWSQEALEQFAKWGGLTPDDAIQAGIFEVDDARAVYPDFDPVPALVLPYYQINGELASFDRAGQVLPFCRIRYLSRQQTKSAWGIKQKIVRYGQPGRSGTRAYFPKLIPDWQYIANDVQQMVIITEGEAKALVGALHGFPVIALGGVFNFSQGVEGLLPELLEFKWRGRDVFIVFDSDAQTNPQVMAAEARLVDELMRKLGARCFIVRLPQEGDDKEALDTFLHKFGADALEELMRKTPALGALDAKVVSLNQNVAFIGREGMVWDMRGRYFIKKDSFTKGSEYSAIKHITVGGKNKSGPVEISVAERWLTHPHAQRYGEILFRPGEGRTVMSDSGQLALNMWEGWHPEPGDVTPFLQLSEYLFQHLPADLRDFPIKLMAYKAQHPAEKIGIALVLIGPQGCGKSLWCDTVGAAFRPYAQAIPSSEFGGDFQSWMENTIFCQIQEVEPIHLQRFGERLKSLITDRHQQMNEKYRPKRQISSFTQYALTSNKRAIGSYSHDDRRMFVVNCPDPLARRFPQETYDTLGANKGKWFHSGGPQQLLHYLLNLDLGDWKPPARAPVTSEKLLAYSEGLTMVQTIAEQMKNGDDNMILQWCDAAMAWADAALSSNDPRRVAQARAIGEAMQHMPIRPFYEPTELVKLLPNVVETLVGTKLDRTQPPGQLSRELREAGVPYLLARDDARGFFWRGAWHQYLVVHSFEDWKEPIGQDYFENYMNNCPTYGQIRRRR